MTSTAQQEAHAFKHAAEEALVRLGARLSCNAKLGEWELFTSAGRVRVDVFADYIVCRFDEEDRTKHLWAHPLVYFPGPRWIWYAVKEWEGFFADFLLQGSDMLGRMTHYMITEHNYPTAYPSREAAISAAIKCGELHGLGAECECGNMPLVMESEEYQQCLPPERHEPLPDEEDRPAPSI